jgi:hypothetical protein
MNISAIKTRLAEIALTVPGIKRTYANAPQSLPDTDLPIIIPFAGPVVAPKRISEELYSQGRQFILRLYVKPIQQGYDGEAEKAVEPFLDTVRDTFLAHPALGTGIYAELIEGVEEITWQGDSGVSVLKFGEEYLGAEFRLTASTMHQVNISNYE